MPVGAKYVIVGDRSVAVASQSIAVGDKVICMKYNGGVINPPVPIVGDNVLLMPFTSGKVALRSYERDNFISVWHRDVAYNYEEVDMGSFTFNWDGNGSVYLSSESETSVSIQTDDAIRATTVLGSLSFEGTAQWQGGEPINAHLYSGRPNITSICQIGYNSIHIYIYDMFWFSIGSSDIYIMSA